MDQEKDGGKLMEQQTTATTNGNNNYLKRIDVTMDENKTAGRYLFNIDHLKN